MANVTTATTPMIEKKWNFIRVLICAVSVKVTCVFRLSESKNARNHSPLSTLRFLLSAFNFPSPAFNFSAFSFQLSDFTLFPFHASFELTDSLIQTSLIDDGFPLSGFKICSRSTRLMAICDLLFLFQSLRPLRFPPSMLSLLHRFLSAFQSTIPPI